MRIYRNARTHNSLSHTPVQIYAHTLISTYTHTRTCKLICTYTHTHTRTHSHNSSKHVWKRSWEVAASLCCFPLISRRVNDGPWFPCRVLHVVHDVRICDNIYWSVYEEVTSARGVRNIKIERHPVVYMYLALDASIYEQNPLLKLGQFHLLLLVLDNFVKQIMQSLLIIIIIVHN